MQPQTTLPNHIALKTLAALEAAHKEEIDEVKAKLESAAESGFLSIALTDPTKGLLNYLSLWGFQVVATNDILCSPREYKIAWGQEDFSPMK